jgi:hypothetical protein
MATALIRMRRSSPDREVEAETEAVAAIEDMGAEEEMGVPRLLK